jgi:hypothetical protein
MPASVQNMIRRRWMEGLESVHLAQSRAHALESLTGRGLFTFSSDSPTAILFDHPGTSGHEPYNGGDDVRLAEHETPPSFMA